MGQPVDIDTFTRRSRVLWVGGVLAGLMMTWGISGLVTGNVVVPPYCVPMPYVNPIAQGRPAVGVSLVYLSLGLMLNGWAVWRGHRHLDRWYPHIIWACRALFFAGIAYAVATSYT